MGVTSGGNHTDHGAYCHEKDPEQFESNLFRWQEHR